MELNALKILTVNRNYFITGGPEKYMFSLMENMSQHRFIPFCVAFEQNRETPYSRYFVSPPGDSGSVYYKDFKMSPVQKAAYAFNSIYHREARCKLEQLIRDERPDLALFLNAVYFSDSIIDACRAHNVPIIWRLSDFHKICASYFLYRDGHVCLDCLEHGLTSAIHNRCGGYQRSLGAALIKVAGMWLSRTRNVYDNVDFFITPSAFTREKMIQGGFRPEKIVHIPTPVATPENRPKSMANPPEVLYVGRLSMEKGIDILLESFRLLKCANVSLVIAGDDSTPYAQELKAQVPVDMRDRITFLGFRNQEQLDELFMRSYCVVIPSVTYDNQPNSALEGMAHALPAIVSDLGSLKEMIVHGETGYHFLAGNAQDLAYRLDDLLRNPLKAYEMGIKARNYVLKNHSMLQHLYALETLFMSCAKDKHAKATIGSSETE
jgi:glycosyltransferase involved in cell wall biosynthesis